jgi:molybdenum cofactor cytidylyltransferase
MRILRPWTGILLAAGAGRRFDPDGRQDKLLQALPDGEAVALRSAARLLAALPDVVAVVRPGALHLSQRLRAAGCRVEVCDEAGSGMAASLVCGLRHSADSAGWVVALADMPYLHTTTVSALLDALRAGADIAVPVHQGRRGNPVGFSRVYLPQLLELKGDQGARALLHEHAVMEITVDDAGIHRDIDTRSDLE